MTTQTLKLNKFHTNIVNNNDLEKRVFRGMVYFSSFLVLCYFLLLSNMVWNIVSRKSLETQAMHLNNEVSNLELQYLASADKIDLDLAHSMGFTETKNKQFAKNTALGGLNTIAYNGL